MLGVAFICGRLWTKAQSHNQVRTHSPGYPTPRRRDHLHQHAFAQPAVGDPQPLTGKGAADGVENGATGEHEVGALGADTGVGDTIFVAPAQQTFDHARHFVVDHPAAVDAAAL